MKKISSIVVPLIYIFLYSKNQLINEVYSERTSKATMVCLSWNYMVTCYWKAVRQDAEMKKKTKVDLNQKKKYTTKKLADYQCL